MIFDPIRKLYQDELLAQFDWLDHGFGTRTAGPWLGEDQHAALHQIHSDIVVKAEGNRGRLGAGDALITDVAGLMVGVRTADCVPILLADPLRHAVAAVHAGWRGTVARIAARAVEAMACEFGTRPSDLVAAIGPAIGPCCYEVGPDVANKFAGLVPELADCHGPAHLDLPEINRMILASAGVPEAQIHAARLCTRCRAEDFYSFRREGERAGRMLTAIGVRS
ncbi:MAG: peptidoglycan editing factor PgeF [Bryobacteraceae bacterium]